MSTKKKTLGKVAHEAHWLAMKCPRYAALWDVQHKTVQNAWERAAQAVVAHLVADMSSPENEAIFDIIREKLFSEERERIAEAMLAREARGMTPCFLPAVVPDYARWIRAGGKP